MDNEDILDSLDFERLKSGDRRALNPDNQHFFDRYYMYVDAIYVLKWIAEDANVGEAGDAYEMKQVAAETISLLNKENML